MNHLLGRPNLKLQVGGGSRKIDVQLKFDDEIIDIENYPYKEFTRLDLKCVTSTPSYFHEFEATRNSELPPPMPSLLVRENYDIDREVQYIVKDFKLWKTIKQFVRMTSDEKNKILKIIEDNHSDIYFDNIKPFVRIRSLSTNPYFYAINSVFLTGETLDVFHLKYSLFDPRISESIVRDIFCTRTKSQLNKIKEGFENSECAFKSGLEYHLDRLLVHIESKSALNFILRLLNTERSDSTTFDINDSFLNDFSLFTDTNYYHCHKHKFMDIFARASYHQIREMCNLFQKRHGITLMKSISSKTGSFVKKCAITICEYAINPYKYFAHRLRKCVVHADIFGIIRIVTSRAEVDLGNIIREYRNLYEYDRFQSIKSSFEDYPQIYFDIILPLCGLERKNRI
ncbi:Annexin D5 [Thelohanellus kitauei]|uniref:Annexin D5 n=1 Tax=Thelohanellus kitauei TaxID=669202 RepID=A0A0C2J8Z5_THEKT|nr:Annexin D5 [Thelohanellus kitauei]